MFHCMAPNRASDYLVPKRMKPLFVGREPEIAHFTQLWKKQTPSLIVCQGRRRIGKSTLFRHCAKQAVHFLVFEGLAPRENIGKSEQLAAFAERISAQTKAPKVPLESWPQAFQLLHSVLPSAGRLVLLLDEVSWMAVGDPDFPGHLKFAWDNFFSQHPGLILVVCGSVSSWIQANILNNTGFVGRSSWNLKLSPLPLPACNEFWKRRRVSAAEKLKVLAVTGGVPRYLEEIDPAQTAEQNIERLCFNPGGLLFSEFGNIFHDIFSRRADNYRQIVRTLVDRTMSVTEISKALRQRRGGTLSSALLDLESAGFVSKDVSFSPDTAKTRTRTIRYRISDNYLRFYLKYVDPETEQIKKGIYQGAPLEALRAWDAIVGLQFENLILSNCNLLIAKIGLGNIPVVNAGPYFQAKTKKLPGCQIDLMLRTKGSIYVFEIKCRKEIKFAVIEEVKKKVAALHAAPSLSVRTGLIFQGVLDPEIEKSDYFDHIVPFEELLE
jgi:AAA+ ATPase superfamily predicted ATPase